MKKIVVLIGGSGSNLEAILQTIEQGELELACVKVISHVPDVLGLKRAQRFGVPTEVIAHADYDSRGAFEDALATSLYDAKPDYIVLAGFMRILSASFVEQFPNQILNIHPSLLPKYRGLHTHQRALEAQEHTHGVSIHLVTPELDAGPVLAQSQLNIRPDDTATSLAARVLRLEHSLYPLVLNWLAQDRLKLGNPTITLDREPIPKQGFLIEFNMQEASF